jgi:hypothetical protein
MPSFKSATIYGARLALESGYGVAATLTDADYLLLEKEFQADTPFVNDGSRGQDARSGGILADVRMSGQSLKCTLSTLLRTAAAPFSNTVFPIEAHRLFRIAGHSATLAATTYTYAPVTDDETSGTLDLHGFSQKWSAHGVLASSLTIEAKAGGLVNVAVMVEGIGASPVDAALPSVSAYDVSTPPLKFDGRADAAVIGAWTGAVLREFKFVATRDLHVRPSGTTTGALAGYAPGRRKAAKFSIKAEAVALSVFNPYTARDTGAVVPISCSAGITGTKQITVATQYGQIKSVKESKDGSVTIWDIEVQCFGGPDGNSDYTIALSQS